MEGAQADIAAGSSGREPAPGRLRLVQELINTYDPESAAEGLAGVAELERWLRERALIEPGERLGGADLRRARAFREGLRTLLEERSHGAVRSETVRALNELPHRALLRTLFDADGVPELVPAAAGLDRAIGELLAIIGESARDGTWARLKVCAEESCMWAFYDRSKNRSGSWCSMAACGNRAKARSYRRRHRAESDA